MAIAFFRTIIIYLFIMIGLRVMGKRQIGELEPSELVLAMLISDLAAVPMQDLSLPLLTGLIPITTLLAITMILSVLSMKSVWFRRIACGTPTVIMENGRMLPKEMNKVRVTIDELTEELRLQGISDYTTVRYAILENSGQISVIQYQHAKPPSADDLARSVKEPGLSRTLINDGRILKHQLKEAGYTQKQLHALLLAQGYHNAREVFFLSVNEQGGVSIIPKEETT